MSASLVRKALDDTTFTTEGKLEQLSKASKKKFKPKSKKNKISKEQLLKQNLKILQALEYKAPRRKEEAASSKPSPSSTVATDLKNTGKNKKSKKGKQQPPNNNSVFTDEDFEKFEREYFVN